MRSRKRGERGGVRRRETVLLMLAAGRGEGGGRRKKTREEKAEERSPLDSLFLFRDARLFTLHPPPRGAHTCTIRRLYARAYAPVRVRVCVCVCIYVFIYIRARASARACIQGGPRANLAGRADEGKREPSNSGDTFKSAPPRDRFTCAAASLRSRLAASWSLVRF